MKQVAPAALSDNDDFVLVPEAMDEQSDSGQQMKGVPQQGKCHGGLGGVRHSPSAGRLSEGRPITPQERQPSASPSTSSTSLPIPVPTQVKAYEQMQRSNRDRRFSGDSPTANSSKMAPGTSVGGSPSPLMGDRQSISSQDGDISQQRVSSGSVQSLTSLSPPNGNLRTFFTYLSLSTKDSSVCVKKCVFVLQCNSPLARPLQGKA